MVSVIFEVWPHPEHRAGYLDWAAELKNELVKMEGLIPLIERFQSLTDPALPPAAPGRLMMRA